MGCESPPSPWSRGERRHKYHLADFGLTRAEVDSAFSRYRDFPSRGGHRASSLS